MLLVLAVGFGQSSTIPAAANTCAVSCAGKPMMPE
jgi:hypothetical protein